LEDEVRPIDPALWTGRGQRRLEAFDDVGDSSTFGIDTGSIEGI
jgi:hypothetical protein